MDSSGKNPGTLCHYDLVPRDTEQVSLELVMSAARKLIHSYIDVYEYPDGRIEMRADGVNLAYERYDRLPQVDTAAMVENKRLSYALQAALMIQTQRDDPRKSITPSRTNQGHAPYSPKALRGTKR